MQPVDAQRFVQVGVVDLNGIAGHAGEVCGDAAVTRAFEQCSEVETVAVWESKWTPAISTPPGAACS